MYVYRSATMQRVWHYRLLSSTMLLSTAGEFSTVKQETGPLSIGFSAAGVCTCLAATTDLYIGLRPDKDIIQRPIFENRIRSFVSAYFT